VNLQHYNILNRAVSLLSESTIMREKDWKGICSTAYLLVRDTPLQAIREWKKAQRLRLW